MVAGAEDTRAAPGGMGVPYEEPASVVVVEVPLVLALEEQQLVGRLVAVALEVGLTKHMATPEYVSALIPVLASLQPAWR